MYIINHFGAIVNKKDIDNLEDLKNKTTLIPASTFGNFQQNSVKCYMELKDHILLPVYFALEHLGKPKLCKFAHTTIKPLQSPIVLRETQIEPYKACIEESKKDFGGGILSLTTASGKTIISLRLIADLKLKTVIVINKIELLKQWKEQIEKWIPDAKVGLVQGDVFDIQDKDIVLATLQTVTIKKALTGDNFKSFGVCFIDEIHNISSQVFSRIMFKIRPKLIYGLTATLERKDGLHKLIHMYIGEILYDNTRDSTSSKQKSEIWVYQHTGVSTKEVKLRDGTPSVATMLTNIANDDERTKKIVEICKVLRDSPGRNILVVSDRIHQLKKIHMSFPKSSGLFIGGMKKEELEKTKEKQIILATYQYVSEGVNIPKLNTLIFATPRSNITQAIGRIYRKIHDVTPVIVDIHDHFSLFNGQYYKRRKIYKDSIEDVEILNKV